MIGTTRVHPDTDVLFRQAPMTAHDYMMHGIHDIDELLGKGYAKAYPELIAAYMQTAAMDFGAAVIGRAIESVADQVEAIGMSISSMMTRHDQCDHD